MKRFIHIFVLTAILSGIFFLWFLPNTKGEEKVYHLATEVPEETNSDIKTDTLSKTKRETPKRTAEPKKSIPQRTPQKKSAPLTEKTVSKKLAIKDLDMPLYSRGRPLHMRTPPPTKTDSIFVSIPVDTTAVLP